ncbi:MAG: UDP-N-acetylmuramoyl-L-alanyl-D-glutamate--2,6-diaminopimelate ligase [Burkholderiaceae bacterium]|jgi:UDP-N-acetylmuramoyl-L-alanyl-D-glutamate--2,6-diaminopimelate ligase|nr:UDP-N-acetylmuramoyl-L-alanyl-D-glutamate--2,6-diaminopimelate ligase [Burkholderiaceae bacterium]
MSTRESQIKAAVEWLRKIIPAGDLFADSREISAAQGAAVFFAYPGDGADRRAYIAHAIASGAKAVIYEQADFVWEDAWQVPHLAVNGLQALAGPIAAAWYEHPSTSLFVAAITGTNGKTSCAQWIGEMLSRTGRKTAVIGTLGVTVFVDGQAGSPDATGYTTPEPLQLQRRLSGLLQAGVSCVAIEASSIGIEAGRLNGLNIDVALYTNFTRDHLDYHKDMTEYAAAKRKLFDWPGLKHSIMNLDDAKGREWVLELASADRPGLLGYTITGEKADDLPVLDASEIHALAGGTTFLLHSPYGQSRIKTRLLGNFNVSNVLGTLGVLLTTGTTWETIIPLVSKLQPPPGRMQPLGGDRAPLVVIDYAHTPDALGKGLAALRTVASDRKGELWCVFGCGGDRDKGKRGEMGRAAESADHIIVTSDNPRSEEPGQIIKDILSGMTKAVTVLEDRASAILQAVRQAMPNDVIFLAGKGHEAWQEVQGVKYPFADADHAALALAAFETMKRGQP